MSRILVSNRYRRYFICSIFDILYDDWMIFRIQIFFRRILFFKNRHSVFIWVDGNRSVNCIRTFWILCNHSVDPWHTRFNIYIYIYTSTCSDFFHGRTNPWALRSGTPLCKLHTSLHLGNELSATKDERYIRLCFQCKGLTENLYDTRRFPNILARYLIAKLFNKK